MPRLLGAFLPGAATDLAEALGGQVEDDRMQIAVLSKGLAGLCVDATVAVAKEDATGVEDRHSQVVLGLSEHTVHPVDGATGGFGLLVDADDQELLVDEAARRSQRDAVGGPLIEKGVDASRQLVALCRIEARRDTEQPDTGVVGQVLKIGLRHCLILRATLPL